MFFRLFFALLTFGIDFITGRMILICNIHLGFFKNCEDQQVKFFSVGCMHNENDAEEMHLDWPR